MIFSEWWTKETLTSETSSTTRVFKGNYKITVKDGDEILGTKTLSIIDDQIVCFGADDKCKNPVKLKSSQSEEFEGSGNEIDISL